MGIIFALRGRANSGKTTTISLLYELTIGAGFQIVRTNFGIYMDFSSVFLYKGKRIGITSSGDNHDLVHARLQEFAQEGCEICICACRTYGGTNSAIENIPGYRHDYLEKSIGENVETQRVANQGDAQRLLTCITNSI